MATVSGIFTFALPDDINTDKLRIYVSSTEGGTYTLDTTFNYTYGYRTQEYDSVNDTQWYKIQFYNSVDDETGPLSNPIYGGDFNDKAQPFLALSSSFDGANYSSASDLYDLTGLTLSDISVTKVQSILRESRAYIDMLMDEHGLNDFRRYFNSSTSRKKYNAKLRLIKSAEINMAAAVVFRSLADNKQMDIVRGTVSDNDKIAIGSTRIESEAPMDSYSVLIRLSDKYAEKGAKLLNSITPSSIPLSYSDKFQKGPLFIHPTEATGNIYVSSTNTGDTFVQYTADLTGLGDDINGVYFSLNNNAVVEGQASQNVDPLEAQAAIVDATLTVNGVIYHLDDWVDNGTTTQPGSGGTTGGTDGFSVKFANTSFIDMIWNNTTANGGFDLVAGDEVIFKYWVLGNS